MSEKSPAALPAKKIKNSKRRSNKRKLAKRKCVSCNKRFTPKDPRQKYCTKQCFYDHPTSGRKWFDGKDEKEVITKCTEAWRVGGTDANAAFLAGITNMSLSRYLEAHPDVAEYRDKLRDSVLLRARQAVYDGLNSYANGMDYLERKGGEEFLKRPPAPPQLEQHFYFERQNASSNQLEQNAQTESGVGLFDGPNNH